jgi:DNA-directed RNA polymerase subunit M/transcription elongation factor TFIIS
MDRTFADAPHAVVTLRRPDVDGSPDLERALDQTAGGVLVVGVAYEEQSAPPAPADATAGECCPECGAPAAGVESAPSSPGEPVTLVYVCGDCGAAWDL